MTPPEVLYLDLGLVTLSVAILILWYVIVIRNGPTIVHDEIPVLIMLAFIIIVSWPAVWMAVLLFCLWRSLAKIKKMI